MKRKLLAFALSSALLLSISACDSSGSSSGNVEANNEETVENEIITISVDSWGEGNNHEIVEREGTYSGTMINGIPEGKGTFTTENDSGVSWTYTGEFKDGMFDGQGETVWNELEKYQIGTYSAGLFQPNTPELFNSLSNLTSPSFSISTENMNFMQEHLNLFPAVTDSDITEAQTYVKTDLTYPMMTKTLDGLEGVLFYCNPAQALQVFQEDIYGHTITYIFCGDENNNYYSIFYDGVLPDVYDGVYISFTGLPVSPSGFENVGGGTTNVIVMIASSVAVV